MNEKILAELLDRKLRKKIQYYDLTDSTNTRLKELAGKGAEEGTLVVADGQTAGRGRLGRSFVSEKGRGVYMSVLLRPNCRVDGALSLTPTAAVAVCRALESFGIYAEIKWVNDIFLGGKKICGILCESAVSPEGELQYAVIGVGLNVTGLDFPRDIRDIAGSIQSQSGRIVSREELCAGIYRELTEIYGMWKHDHACCLEDYRARSFVIGKTVRVMSTQGEHTADVLGITEDFGLLVTENGRQRILNSNEISIKKA